MRVLVTGSNGFVGSWIVKELKSKHYIIGCGTKEKAISDVDDYVRWDIGHEDIPANLLEMKIDAVVHAASSKSIDDTDLELSYANLLGTQRVTNLCRMPDTKIAILVSSIPIVKIGMFEGEKIRESNPLYPPTMYHATKAAQELMWLQMEKAGVRQVSLRVPSPIAPVMGTKTIFTIFAEKALRGENIVINGKGSRRQNYIDVRDVTQAIDRLLDAPDASGVYNIGSEVTVSNVELAEKCIALSNSRSQIVFSENDDPADGQVWEIDTSRLKADTGFRQQYTIEQTISEYIKEKSK